MDSKEFTRYLYVAHAGFTLRIKLTKTMQKRINYLQDMIKKYNLKRNERINIEIQQPECFIQISRNMVDIGEYCYDGWTSYIPELRLRRITDLPPVYFSSYFKHLYFTSKWDVDVLRFNTLILPKHKELLVWEKIVGGT